MEQQGLQHTEDHNKFQTTVRMGLFNLAGYSWEQNLVWCFKSYSVKDSSKGQKQKPKV